MDNSTQVNEDYKFRFAYVLETVKAMFSTSSEIGDKELVAKIEEVKNQQDSKYITNLEKDVETHETTKKKEMNRKSTKINNVVKENEKLKSNEAILDEEKDR